jgi:aryl-phospho-beta-D-glucosidase BglC (GH1 family)
MKIFSLLVAGCVALNWQTKDNSLFYKGEKVVLHGLGTSCTPNLIKGLGEKCWNIYNWSDKSNIITAVDNDMMTDITQYLVKANVPGVMGAVRIPLCASSWLGMTTESSAANMAKYPGLGGQYQALIT